MQRTAIAKDLLYKINRPSSIENATEVLATLYPNLDILGVRIQNRARETILRFLSDLKTTPYSAQVKKLLDVIGKFVLHRPEYEDMAYEWVLRFPYQEQLDVLIQHHTLLKENEDLWMRLYHDVRNDLTATPRPSPEIKRKLWRIVVLYEYHDLRPLAGQTRAARRRE